MGVPAQKEAGVLKKQTGGEGALDEVAMKRLQKDAELGKAYREDLTLRARRAAMLLELGLDDVLWQRVLRAMPAEDLRAVTMGLERKTAELFAPAPQMTVEKDVAREQNSAFLI